MKNFIVIISVVLLTLTSNYLGYINPPFSIEKTPILIGLFAIMLLYLTDFKVFIKLGVINGLIILNDILIKLFAGGIHDSEGLGFISAYLIFGLIILLVLILVYGFTKQSNNKKEYFLTVFSSSIIIFAYLTYFRTLGME